MVVNKLRSAAELLLESLRLYESIIYLDIAPWCSAPGLEKLALKANAN